MKTISKITVNSWNQDFHNDQPTKDATYSMGIFIEETADKQIIHLFSIEQRFHIAPFKRSVFKICTTLVEQIDAEKTVNDFEWTYTASGGHTKIIFHEQHGYITGVKFTNSFPIENAFFTSRIEEYQKAINAGERCFEILSDGHPERYEGKPMHSIIVPLPKHPDKHHIIESAYHNLENYKIVFADSEKFMAYWIEEIKEKYCCETMDDLERFYEAQPSKGDDTAFPPFHASIHDSIKHVSPHIGYPDVTAIMDFSRFEWIEKRSWIEKLIKPFDQPRLRSMDQIGFTNGRHRTLNMYKLGAPFLPFTMSSTYENNTAFEQRFGWKGNKK